MDLHREEIHHVVVLLQLSQLLHVLVLDKADLVDLIVCLLELSEEDFLVLRDLCLDLLELLVLDGDHMSSFLFFSLDFFKGSSLFLATLFN